MTPKIKNIAAHFPPKLQGLFEPHRFKVLHGGRGGGKSWGIARALLLLGQMYPLRILCAREWQASIADSVHKLLTDQIVELGLTEFYLVEKLTITGKNGTSFRFAGLKSNVSQIKSFENINICWVEEASNVTKNSWSVLIPTIRGKGFIPNSDAEVWVSYNPDLETDETHQRWFVHPPSNAWIQQMNYDSNPYFPDTLKREMERLKEKDFDDYLHVYEGQCRRYQDGAIYLNELKHAEIEKRITSVPYDPLLPVHAFFDLGYSDATAIVFAQKVGFETHWIDYFESSRHPLDYYMKVLADKPYPVDTIWLPQDARARSLGSGKSTEEIVRSKGKTTRITPNLSKSDQINALRMLFPTLWIDRDRCSGVLTCLRNYRFELEVAEKGGFKSVPVHDRFSHGADAAMYCAVGLKAPKEKPDTQKFFHRWDKSASQQGWMSG